MYPSHPALDRIAISEIQDDRGITYQEFRATLTPRFSSVYMQMFLAHGVLVAVAWILWELDALLPLGVALAVMAPLGALVFGYVIAFLHLFMHEASHHNLAPSRVWNDRLANVLIGMLIGVEIKRYRAVHWEHHKHLGNTNDTETSYYQPLDLRFILESLFGMRVLRVLLARRKVTDTMPAKRRGANLAPRFALVLHAVILTLFAGTHHFGAALAWAAGVAVVFPFFASVRQLLEHRDENAQDWVDHASVPHGPVNFLFGRGPIASTLGGAGFNYHLLHHLDPQVSCTRLDDLEQYLCCTSLCGVLDAQRTTYAARFARLFRWRRACKPAGQGN